MAISRPPAPIIVSKPPFADGVNSPFAAILPPLLSLEVAKAILGGQFQLTDRESDVALLLLILPHDRAIAAWLKCSAHTIKNHRKSIRQKLGVETCRQAAVKFTASLYCLTSNVPNSTKGLPNNG
jgi:DNA-binding CsgD family transcriptional regulator